MDSADSLENSRESNRIFPENSPTLAVIVHSADSSGNSQECRQRFNPENGDDSLMNQSENEAENSAAQEAEIREWIESMDSYQRRAYERAKTFARDMHSDAPRHKKQRVVDFGGPFQDALEVIKNKTSNPVDPYSMCLKIGKGFQTRTTRVAPTLLDLCLKQLGQYAESLVSLRCIPDGLRSKIASTVSCLGEVNVRFMKLLVKDSPSEVRVRNCTNLVESDLMEILHDCDTDTLNVLKLDLCGRSMTEHVIGDFLSRPTKGFPALTHIRLKGAFNLTDSALALISRSAPLLQWVNLSECSLLTDTAIQILADSFGSTLRGLNIEDCQGINPSNALGDLTRFKSLNSLSVAGLEGIDDDFLLRFLEARGSNLTSLVLASCTEVTDESTEAIGRYCLKLQVLDVTFLDKLTDLTLQYIAHGCRSLTSLKCGQNHFSDEHVAAFLELSGSSLKVLSLNNIRKVSVNTVISLAKVSKKLQFLDLSWCRMLKNEHVRMILRSCPSLRQLKLFGCSQVTKEILTEDSGSPVQIIGTSMAPFLQYSNNRGSVFQEDSDSE